MSSKRKVPAWPRCDIEQRLRACRTMLRINGLLTEREGAKVHLRINKLIDKLKKENQL